MAKFSGRIRVLLILTFLSKLTFAVQDALKDPSLEIIRQEDAEEGTYTGYNVKDPNAIPCRDPTPVNGALEVISGIPFMINNITVKLKCLHGLEFPDGTMEKVEHCFAAPTPLRITGIWSPDQGRLVCQEPKNKSPVSTILHKGSNRSRKRFLESLQCLNPKTPTNKVKVLKGNPNHLYSEIEVSCPSGYHFPSGQEVINVTCLPLPDPCYCKAAWETLDRYLLIYDFNCTESLVCNDPKTPDNTVTKLDGEPYHMSSKVRVTCKGGRHFPNGLESVNVTCNPLPHPCMCLAEWMREDNFDLMNDFNCTDQTIKSKVETPASIELRPEEILEAETTKVNTPGEEEETDLNSIPDKQSVDQETSPVINKENNVQSESKASDENESGEHEERNDSNFKRGDFLETNNEIYDTGEQTYRENAYPEEKIVENNEQQDSSQSKEDATVAEEDQNKYPSKNGEILDTEPEKVNFEIKNIKNEVVDNNNVQSLDQQVKPIAQSFVADEDERITNKHEIEDKIKTDEENEGSYETIEEVSYDKTSVSQENEIKNVHQNEQISEDDKSLEEDMTNDITSVKEDEPENVVEDDIEESPKENEIVQEIHESDESTTVNDESDEIESSNEDEEEEKEENEENEIEEKFNSEPEEEEWEPQEGENYQETVEYRENMRPEVVLLGETMPFNEHEISDEEPHDAEQEEEAENFVEVGDNEHIRKTEDEENKGDSQIQEKPVDEEEEEEHREIEEEEEQSNQTQKKFGGREEHEEYDETEDEDDTEIEKETVKGNQIGENYVNAEKKLEDREKKDDKEKEEEGVEEEQEVVEPPPAFYEAQNSPFHKMDEEIQPAEEDVDPCLQGPDSGFGKHAHWRFFYNSSVKECQNFLYGGRGGNANNFETLEDCLKACNTRHS